MIVETEYTPNPETLKFLPGKTVSEIGPVEFNKDNKTEKESVLLASNILSIKGINMVFFGEDFITVKKEKSFKWDDLKHGIIAEINDYYSKGNDVVLKKLDKKNSNLKENLSNGTVNKIIEILDTKIRPAVARDGGNIKFKSFKNGVVQVELEGSCSGCPSSILTLKQGVQNLLCHYIPEVKSVETTTDK